MFKKVYVFTLFTDLPLRGWCCDRGYNYIDSASWREIKMKDIVESDDRAYYDAPKWAEEAIAEGHQYVTLWTNYYK